MSLPRPRGQARPWLSLLVPPAAWLVFEYGLAAALRAGCATVGLWLGPAWGLGSLVACGGAAVLAPRAVRVEPPYAPTSRPWLARIALLGAGVFGLAIALQTLATLIVPSCAR